MVKALVVMLLASTAYADDLLGTRMAYGTISVDKTPMTTMSLGLSFDRPVLGRFRALVEYEYLWLDERDLDTQAMLGVAALAYSGHRISLGLRRRIADKDYARGMFQLFIDAEAGGGAMLVQGDDDALGIAHAFAGARLGLALDMRGHTTANAHRWEYEVIVRALAMPDGWGAMVGIGLVWGDRAVAKGNAMALEQR